MSAIKEIDNKFDTLRRQAEELVQNEGELDPEQTCDFMEIIQELRIHQVELEMQNDELRRTHQELFDLHAAYENLYEYAPCGYLTIDRKGIITRVNLTGITLLGDPKQAVTLSGLTRFIAAGHQNSYLNARNAAGETGEKQSVELRLKGETTPPCWVRADIEADRDESQAVTQWRVILVDISAQKAAQEKARRMEEQLGQSQKIAHLGSFEYIAATKTTVWSEEEYRICGLDPAGPSPHYDVMLATCIHPDDAALLHETFMQAMQRRSIYEMEHRIVRPDGSVRWVYVKAHPHFDEKGNLLGYIGATLDITERKQAEKALARQKAFYEEILQNIREGIWVTDVEDRIIFFNRGMEELAGVVFSDLLGRHLFNDLPEETTRHFLPFYQQARVSLAPTKYEAKVVTFAGRTVARSGWIVPRFWNGCYNGMIFTVEDATARVEAEEALRASEERYRLAQRLSGVGSWEWDIGTDNVQWSNEVNGIFGFEPNVFNGSQRTVENRVHPDDLATARKNVRDCLEDGKSYSSEYRVVWPDGATRWILDVGDVQRDADGRAVRMMGLVMDITERKKQEAEREEMRRKIEQTQRLESLGVLAGGIAHDFNNILVAILGYAELALDEISPFSPARESLFEITVASKRAADLCQQMLAYAGQGRFETRNISLRELIEGLLHMLRTCISKKAVLNLNLDKAMLSMHGDPSQVRQILMNLAINASEAIGDGSGVITISTGVMKCSKAYLTKSDIVASAKPGTYVYIEVSDTGSGMDKETMKSIFEPFFTTKFTGRGLGLSAVMGIVKAHKGALRIRSEIGKGSTFKILFPAVDAPEKRATADVGGDRWRGSGTILLVDDEESIRAVGSERLRRLGFKVLTAEDGRQAVESYRKRRKEIDIVLLDLTMPRLNGEEAFRELRRIDPEVRVILASGYSENDVASRFAGKGLAGCLQKPYSMAKLRALLSILLPEATSSENTEESAAPNKTGEEITSNQDLILES